MDWIQSFFGEQSPGVTLTAIVVGLVVALILLFWIFRKIAGSAGGGNRRGQQPRLSVSDAAPIDDKRRLVIVRRDNVEHLIMIGGASDILIERNIAPPPLPEIVEPDPPAYAPQTEYAAAPAAAATAAAATTAYSAQDPAPAETSADLESEELARQHAAKTARHQDDQTDTVHEAAQVDMPEPEMQGQQPTYPDEQLPEPDLETPMPVDRAPRQRQDESLSRMPQEPEVEYDEPQAPPPQRAHPEVTAPDVGPPEPESAGEPQPERRAAPKSGSNVEDEMQRLLDELSNR